MQGDWDKGSNSHFGIFFQGRTPAARDLEKLASLKARQRRAFKLANFKMRIAGTKDRRSSQSPLGLVDFV